MFRYVTEFELQRVKVYPVYRPGHETDCELTHVLVFCVLLA
jgi:hypothetical protein